MKILLVGGGGREHAMAKALTSASNITLLAAPGNPGIAEHARCIPIAADDVAELVQLARDEKVDLVVVGPEAALVGGIADALAYFKIPCCGPTSQAAMLEGSKAFTRTLAAQAGVPQPRFHVIDNTKDLNAVVRTCAEEWNTLPVIKADGLAAGKGVMLPDSLEECIDATRALLEGSMSDAGLTVVLEERIVGTEASLFFACNGTSWVALPHARDHKRLLDHDKGPNTGGMGAYSPNPDITPEIQTYVENTMLKPVLQALANDGMPYVGFLYIGIMLTATGPQLIEFNCRLGDPEAQVILPRLHDGDFISLCQATACGTLGAVHLRVDPRPVCAVVVCAHGYPEDPRKDDIITVGAQLAAPKGRDCPAPTTTWLIHAGTRLDDTILRTCGGRVLASVGRGTTLAEAKQHAYDGLRNVHIEGAHWRTDIAKTC